MGSVLKDLKFGELNNIKRNDVNSSGDRRRTTTATAIRFATEKAFEINTLASVVKFTGFVVGSRRISRPISEYKDTIVASLATNSPEGSETEVHDYLYKVYIPELEPLPAPTSYDDPIIGLYADVSIAKGLTSPGSETSQPSLDGALVEVTYEDVENLSGPKITRIISTTVASALGLGDPVSSRSAFGSGIPTTNGDPGSFSWSDKKKQQNQTYTWAGTSYTIKNGEIPTALLVEDTETGAQLLPGALADFLKMNEAFKKKFNTPIQTTGGYRDYNGQVSARMRRVSGDRANCPSTANHAVSGREKVSGTLGEGGGQYELRGSACVFVGYAATPGTSKHGWGGAADLTGLSGAQFKWLNKFGLEKFNFVFGVSGEKWHMNWTGLGIVLSPGLTRGMTRVFAKAEHGIGDDTITLV